MPTERTKRDLRIVALVVPPSAAAGAGYVSLLVDLTAASAALGAVIGTLIGGTLASFELFYFHRERGAWLRRRTFLTMIGIKSLIYLCIVVASQLVGTWLFGGLGDPVAVLLSAGFLWGILYSYLVTVLVLFLMQVNRMLGGRLFANFVAGRYHRPVEEERIFLFIDLAESTATAERIGDLRFLDLLNRCFYDLTAAVIEHRGEIYKYVGDEAIVTWRLADGVRGSRCLQCYFALRDRIEAKRTRYLRDFGIVPRFRAGMHAGRVAAGELGDLKQEIAFLGDVVNTTARIEQACRDADRAFLVSAALFDRLALPSGVHAEALGPVRLRGKEELIELFGVEKTDRMAAGTAA